MRGVAAASSTSLRRADLPLSRLYDVALLDLDGVVYIGRDAVPGAAASLAAARQHGQRLAFVTNNAARPPAAVAEHLTELGILADPVDVITSAHAAAHYLAERLSAGAPVLVVGTTGLEDALSERGLVPVHRDGEDVAAVVQGYSPELNWKQLAEGAVAISRGVPWIATNLDPTVPSPRGPLPGNGSFVAALRHATGRIPISTGKPDPTMHRESVQRSAALRPLVVGDRLDTDIEGANAADCASLLVLTGVTGARDLLRAPEHLRPTYVARDLSGLLHSHSAPEVQSAQSRCGSWLVRPVDDAGVRLSYLAPRAGTGSAEAADDLDPLRALCGAVWHPDFGGYPATSDQRDRPLLCAADAESERALAGLGLRVESRG